MKKVIYVQDKINRLREHILEGIVDLRPERDDYMLANPHNREAFFLHTNSYESREMLLRRCHYYSMNEIGGIFVRPMVYNNQILGGDPHGDRKRVAELSDADYICELLTPRRTIIVDGHKYSIDAMTLDIEIGGYSMFKKNVNNALRKRMPKRLVELVMEESIGKIKHRIKDVCVDSTPIGKPVKIVVGAKDDEPLLIDQVLRQNRPNDCANAFCILDTDCDSWSTYDSHFHDSSYYLRNIYLVQYYQIIS